MKEIQVELCLEMLKIRNKNYEKMFKQSWALNSYFYLEIYTGSYRYTSDYFLTTHNEFTNECTFQLNSLMVKFKCYTGKSIEFWLRKKDDNSIKVDFWF